MSRLWHVTVGNVGENAPHLPDVNSEHSPAESTFPVDPSSQHLPSVANYDKLVPKKHSLDILHPRTYHSVIL